MKYLFLKISTVNDIDIHTAPLGLLELFWQEVEGFFWNKCMCQGMIEWMGFNSKSSFTKNQLAEEKGVLHLECGVLIHFHHLFATTGLKEGLWKQSKCQVKDR